VCSFSLIELLSSFSANGWRSFCSTWTGVNPKKQTFLLLFPTQKELIYLCFELKTPHIGRYVTL